MNSSSSAQSFVHYGDIVTSIGGKVELLSLSCHCDKTFYNRGQIELKVTTLSDINTD